MSDFFERLAARTLGIASVVRPLIRPSTALPVRAMRDGGEEEIPSEARATRVVDADSAPSGAAPDVARSEPIPKEPPSAPGSPRYRAPHPAEPRSAAIEPAAPRVAPAPLVPPREPVVTLARHHRERSEPDRHEPARGASAELTTRVPGQTSTPAGGGNGGTVRITIGRLEIRAVRTAAPEPRSPPADSPQLSLADYLARRDGWRE
jgi:hypothetical protein